MGMGSGMGASGAIGAGIGIPFMGLADTAHPRSRTLLKNRACLSSSRAISNTALDSDSPGAHCAILQ